MLVRLARPHEMADIAALRVEAYVHGGFLDPATPYAEKLRQLGAGPGDETLLAEDQGDIAGTAALLRLGPDSNLPRTSAEVELRALAVSPKAQGRGVGRRLVQAAIGRAAAGGARRLLLCTQAGMDAAQWLYESMGFQRRPELDWVPEGTRVDLRSYSLELWTVS